MRSRQGFVLITSLIITTVILGIAAGTLAFARFERIQTGDHHTDTRSNQVLNTGGEDAIALIHHYSDPRAAICAHNGGSPATSSTCDYTLTRTTPSGSSYRIYFGAYAYPSNPAITVEAPANNPTERLTIKLDTNLNVRTWNITRP